MPIPRRGLVIFFVHSTASTESFDFEVKDSSKFNTLVSRSAVRVYQNRSGFFSVLFSANSSATPGAADGDRYWTNVQSQCQSRVKLDGSLKNACLGSFSSLD